MLQLQCPSDVKGIKNETEHKLSTTNLRFFMTDRAISIVVLLVCTKLLAFYTSSILNI